MPLVESVAFGPSPHTEAIMLGKVFKAYDVRGTYPDPLDEKMAWQIGYGCSRFLLQDANAAPSGPKPAARSSTVASLS